MVDNRLTNPNNSNELVPPPGEVKEFSLVRYFLAVSLIVIGGATAATTWFTLVEVRKELTQNAVEYATEIVDNLFHQVEQEYLLPMLERGETYDHTDPEQVDALAKVIARASYKHHVRKLYFFDSEGLIIFSTQREHIGFQVPPENKHFYRALKGQVSWVMKRRNDPLDITGSPTAEELLETYVPVRSQAAGDSKTVIGVIEIYQDIEPLRSDLRTSRNRIVALALSSLGALFVVFVAFILKADSVIRQRRQDLMRSNSALRELSRNLEELVEKRTQQLIEKEKLASLGGLAAGIAHEINTPLATIAACSEGSISRLEDIEGIDELKSERKSDILDVRKYLELINSETFHCKEIIRSLLDYSRQTPVTEPSEIDLNAVIEQTLVLVRLNKENRAVEFVTDLRADSEGVLGDSAQIRQVVHNLVENALHAVKNIEEPRIVVRTFNENLNLIFECEDNGCGIPPEIRESVFNPFFTTKPAREGIGLGLALSFSITQRHGGDLEIAHSVFRDESNVNGGTVFRLSLPRARKEAALEP